MPLFVKLSSLIWYMIPCIKHPTVIIPTSPAVGMTSNEYACRPCSKSSPAQQVGCQIATSCQKHLKSQSHHFDQAESGIGTIDRRKNVRALAKGVCLGCGRGLLRRHRWCYCSALSGFQLLVLIISDYRRSSPIAHKGSRICEAKILGFYNVRK